MSEEPYVAPPGTRMQSFVAIRVRLVRKASAALDVNTATGPDAIGARILRTLSSVLAVPVDVRVVEQKQSALLLLGTQRLSKCLIWF